MEVVRKLRYVAFKGYRRYRGIPNHEVINFALQLIAVTIVALMFASCTGLKKITNSNKETKSEVKTDSVSNTKINNAIKDEVKFQIAQSENEEVNKKIDEILSKINVSKQSGDNSYKLYYDKQLREIKAKINVAETKNETTSTNTEKSFEEKTDEYIEKKLKLIPWWVYALALFWLLPHVLNRLQLIYNPLSGFIKK